MRKLCIIFSIIFSCFFISCDTSSSPPPIKVNEPYVFSTQYTEEEHIQRIEERTYALFEREIIGELVLGFSVDIVYSINENKPEYFVVEIEYDEKAYYGYSDDEELYIDGKLYEWGSVCEHIMGYIYQEEYYVLENAYIWRGPNSIKVKNCIKEGKSPYSLSIYSENKKYYGYKQDSYGVYGVEVNGEILQLATTVCLEHYYEFETHAKELQQAVPIIECATPSGGIIPKDSYEQYKGVRRAQLKYHKDAKSKTYC